ncbi:PASTA domain-containing protein [Nocardioides sp. MJB4]|uniref:non-specific serine/threonine protein kinase n=2 Tax=Nocardioides donggukensis TaxID=2774019 RepID=A0A927PZI2_9ACTN|nr:PASTA domain-containing protein [Nocardioides donggukensis]
MASVYEATDTRLDRPVAVKVMHPGMGDDGDFAARFVREARHAARLSHPHVVGVYDQGEEDGVVYLAMEYVPGHTLRDVIRHEAPMPPAKALALIEPVLSALRAAHGSGLIHRDIKPENVLIADDGRVKVADFGLAKAVSADTQHTATGGVLIGTVSYLAPELVVDGRADARADVYAAGVVLFELLTGRKPHEGESPIQVAYKHVHEDTPAPSSLVPDVPGYVDALVARATARDRGHRPADAAVLLHQVHRVRHALAEGVREDAELVADLAPPVSLAAALPPAGTGPDLGLSLSPSLDPGRGPAGPPEDTASDPLVEPEDTSAIHPFDAAGDPPGWRVPPPPVGEPAAAAYRPRRRRGPVLLLVALLVAALTGGGAWWFGVARYTTAPGVIELTSAQAQAKVESAGLEFAVGDEVYSESVPAGSVISTDPDAGDRVLDGGTVTATLSLGLERYDVPRVRSLDEDAAQAAIQDANLDFGRSIGRFHPTIPEGRAIKSDPKAGKALKRGGTVNVILSKGPPPIKVVDWTGKDADRAEESLSGKGLRVDTSEAYDDDVPAGRVVSQTPSSGQLFKGRTVSLVVSLGPQLVEVPRVVGSGTESAEREIRGAGLVPQVEKHPDYIGLGWVVRVSPGQGSEVPKGSTVTLTVI